MRGSDTRRRRLCWRHGRTDATNFDARRSATCDPSSAAARLRATASEDATVGAGCSARPSRPRRPPAEDRVDPAGA